MLWARGSIADRVVFGVVAGETLGVHSGDMFGAVQPTGEQVPLAKLTWLTPCHPGKFLALWNNSHQAAVKTGAAIPLEPLYFAKTEGSFCAHYAPIRVPAGYDGRVVYEGELGVVIGRETRSASIEEAASAIFGFTCVNDVTALEIPASPSGPEPRTSTPSGSLAR